MSDQDKLRKQDRERNAVRIAERMAEREARQEELVRRGERMTGHGVHDNPGPHGDYNER